LNSPWSCMMRALRRALSPPTSCPSASKNVSGTSKPSVRFMV